MERVLVTGATGFIGFEVARQLAERGVRPRVLVRRPLRGALFRTLDVEVVQGDLESPPSLERAVRGVDTVLHLGARATFEDYALLRPTIVDGSLELAEASARAGVSMFVHASSLLVYDSQTEAIDRTTPAVPRLGYGRAKLESEQRLAELAARAGMSFAAIRLPHVYGARDLVFEQVRRGRVVYPGRGGNAYAHLHVADAALAMILVAEQRWQGISAVADEQPATWSEFFAVVARLYPRLRLLRVPARLALLATIALSAVRRSRRRPFLYTPDAVRGANMTLPVAPGLLWDELGARPHYRTIEEGIPAVLDDCVAFRWIHPLADREG